MSTPSSQVAWKHIMISGPTPGSYLSRGGPGGHCRYPRTGVPLLVVSRQEARVVILNYALTAEQPDPCGPEPYSPSKRPRTRSPLGEGPVTPHVPEEVALSRNSWGPRTSQGVPDPRRVLDPIYYPDPSAGRNRHSAWGWSGAST